MVKYPLAGGVSKTEMKNHIERFLEGKAEPFFKSEEVPVPNDGPVTTIVGKNFNEIVLDENKDVLLEIYAPWCGHCKKLEPVWAKLGEEFQNNPNVVIAKMDGTANEVADVNVRGFPTIKFYPAGSKTSKGTDYDGEREYEDFVAYINRNGKAKKHDEL
jgi:protein disulfide isomerase